MLCNYLFYVAMATVVVEVCGIQGLHRPVHHRVQQLHSSSRTNHSSLSNHRLAHHNLQAHKHVKNVAKSPSSWKKFTNTLSQVVLGNDDDTSSSSSQDDSSSSLDSRDSSLASRDSSLDHTTKRSPWKAMASSGFAQITYSLLQRLWGKNRNKRKNRKSSKSRKNTIFRITSPIPFPAKKQEVVANEAAADGGAAVDGGAAIDGGIGLDAGVIMDGGAAVGAGIAENINKLSKGGSSETNVGGKYGQEDVDADKVDGDILEGSVDMKENTVSLDQLIFKLAGKEEALNNPLKGLMELKKELEDSGRKLSFIEYAAFLEITVLAFIAAMVLRAMSLGGPIPILTKAIQL